MPRTSKTKLSADAIAEKASRGEDISGYFTNKFTVVRPIRRVNVDLTQGVLRGGPRGSILAVRQSSRPFSSGPLRRMFPLRKARAEGSRARIDEILRLRD